MQIYFSPEQLMGSGALVGMGPAAPTVIWVDTKNRFRVVAQEGQGDCGGIDACVIVERNTMDSMGFPAWRPAENDAALQALALAVYTSYVSNQVFRKELR